MMEDPLKVFISADMEGVSGVVDASQTRMEEREYERARKLMTGEVNAAIEGALLGGATDVVVNDSHGSMRNILIEDLNPAAELISGSPKPFSMMQGIGPEFGAAFFVGYHAGAGTGLSVLDHTYYGRVVYQAMVNGRVLSETGLNAALAGYHGVPVALVTGDKTLCDEARGLLGDVETAAVKEACGRLAAQCLPPSRAQALIRAAGRKALLAKHAPFILTPPFTLVTDMLNTSLADIAGMMPGARRTGPRRLEYAADDYVTIFQAFRTMVTLAGTLV
jgi:D-amino peptidase